MPAIYDNSDVRFLYPENWSLTDEEKEEWPRSVTLQSPSSAFLTLLTYPSPQSPNQLALDAVSAMREAYEEVESEEVFEKIGATDTVGYNMDFIYLDFIVRAEVRSFSHGNRTFVVLCQAETREFDEMASVFRAITISLLRS